MRRLRLGLSSIPWPGWVLRLRRTVGRRGFFLFVLAYVDLLYGYTLWSPPDPGEVRRRYLAEAVPFFDDVDASMRTWAVYWWITGAVCLLNVLRRNDWIGYAAAAMLKVAWTVALVLAASNGLGAEGWRAASVWFLVMCAVLVIGSWAEEPYVLADMAARQADE